MHPQLLWKDSVAATASSVPYRRSQSKLVPNSCQQRRSFLRQLLTLVRLEGHDLQRKVCQRGWAHRSRIRLDGPLVGDVVQPQHRRFPRRPLGSEIDALLILTE